MKMRRVGRIIALALLTLALLLTAACSLVASAGQQSGTGQVSSTVTEDFTVGAAPELVASSQVGAISVQAGDAGKISVEAIKRARNQGALDRIEVGITQDGNVVRLEYQVPQGLGGISSGDPNVEFRVTAPAGTKAILTTETGAIEVLGLTSGVTARTTTGAISTRGVKGLQTLTATTGGIAVASADGTVQATTVTGGIDVDGLLVGENWARATTGAVTVRLPASASLKLSAKGTTVQNDFGLSAQGGKLGGSIGAGTGGSLDATTTTGLVQVVKK